MSDWGDFAVFRVIGCEMVGIGVGWGGGWRKDGGLRWLGEILFIWRSGSGVGWSFVRLDVRNLLESSWEIGGE